MMVKQVISEIMTEQDMTALGLEAVAYVKAVDVDGEACFGIFAADGTEITVVTNRDVAFAAVRQQDLEPLSVH
ncbi:DUF1150 family protein [Kiloniella laminariae]|uniref:DUF1150 family protein n=1 Tax=Kiloniella laminariae TaxID=454162 RepID=A0ABT4LKB1_9PROT|nr:DUF1150 family protein [Kiloniella laminariae]MCZ4281533.1 DUF1150 family protein [Kiloniella laminariae]